MASRSITSLLRRDTAKTCANTAAAIVIRHSDVGWHLRYANKQEEHLTREAFHPKAGGWARYDRQRRAKEPIVPAPNEQ